MRDRDLTGFRTALASALIALPWLPAGCSPTGGGRTGTGNDLPVLDPVECSKLTPEETYALAREIPPQKHRPPDDPRPYLAGVRLTYLAYGFACVYAVGENLDEKEATNGDVAMLLEVQGPALNVRERRYPYERCFFDKFFISRPGHIRVALTLAHDRTGEEFDRRAFEAEIGPALRAEVEDAGWSEADGRAVAGVRVRVVADPAHYADRCRVEASLLELAAPDADRGRLLGRWKLKLEPQDDAVFRFDLKAGPARGAAGGSSVRPGPGGRRHYAIRFRLMDGSKVVESLVRRFSLTP
ncbi:MAG: hypothetical protein N3A38_06915 [Planctomycetota bacterium]|nr:hypothetical protein [Planctomycetota bacterium]